MKAATVPILVCVVAGMFAATATRAEGGRIAFSGAVVEPTCSVDTSRPAMNSRAARSDALIDGRRTCGARPGNPGRSYSRTVVGLDATVIANDRLLNYFASYASNADAAAQPRLVIRTYE